MPARSDLGRAVLRAVEHDRAEVSVASVALRVGARLARLSPAAVARLAPRFGAARITDAMVETHRHNR